MHQIDSLDLSPTSPDLESFAARGGKLLIYHGWADQNVAPRSSVNYHAKLVETMGEKQVNDSVRLFFAPGMAHCGGGEGPNTFDALTALEQWREQGKAPTEIIASHLTNGKVDRTRPLCPYPQVATYKGTGSIDQAENFCLRRGPALSGIRGFRGCARITTGLLPTTRRPRSTNPGSTTRDQSCPQPRPHNRRPARGVAA